MTVLHDPDRGPSRSAYCNLGCRCDRCTEAQRQYALEHNARLRGVRYLAVGERVRAGHGFRGCEGLSVVESVDHRLGALVRCERCGLAGEVPPEAAA